MCGEEHPPIIRNSGRFAVKDLFLRSHARPLRIGIRVLENVSVYAVMLVVAGVMLIPFVYMFSMSFTTTYDPYKFSIIPHAPTLKHWVYLIGESRFPRWALNSLLFASVVAFGQVVFGSMAGYALAKLRFPGRKVIFIAILSTMMLPIQVTIVANFFILKNLGWLDTYQGLIVPHLAAAFGVFLMRQFIIQIPDDLMDAARIDGASEYRIFSQIVMPLIKPAIWALFIFNFMWGWNEYFWPLVVLSAPDMYTLTVGLATFQQVHLNDWGLLMGGATASFIPMFVVYLILQRRFVRGIAMTGFGGR